MFNAKFSSISAISLRKQILYYININRNFHQNKPNTYKKLSCSPDFRLFALCYMYFCRACGIQDCDILLYATCIFVEFVFSGFRPFVWFCVTCIFVEFVFSGFRPFVWFCVTCIFVVFVFSGFRPFVLFYLSFIHRSTIYSAIYTDMRTTLEFLNIISLNLTINVRLLL
jgi:hypothetical protein